MDVKDALLSFARRRADILFSLPPLEVAAVAEAELLPRERLDRKLRNADQRLKATYVTGRTAATAAAGGSGQDGAAAAAAAPGSSVQVISKHHASLQDLLRVLADWAVAPQGSVDTAAPALTPVLQHLIGCVKRLALSEPDPQAAQLAKGLGTPTATELLQRQAALAAAEAAVVQKEKRTTYAERRHRLQLRKAVERGGILEAGDWFCANCGFANWRGRQRCAKCGAASRARGNSFVSVQDVTELYGDKPPRRQQREATAAAEADDIYEAQAAAAVDAGTAAARSAAAAAVGPRGRGAGRGVRAPRQLDDEEELPEEAGREAAFRGSQSRGGPAGRRGAEQPPRQRMQGRPGLRRPVDEEAGAEGRRRGADDWDEDGEDEDEAGDDGPSTSRSSRSYQRNMEDFYSEAAASSSGRSRRGRESTAAGAAAANRPGSRPSPYDDLLDDGDDDEVAPARGRRGAAAAAAAAGGGGGADGGRGREAGGARARTSGRGGADGAYGGDDDAEFRKWEASASQSRRARSRSGGAEEKSRTGLPADRDGDDDDLAEEEDVRAGPGWRRGRGGSQGAARFDRGREDEEEEGGDYFTASEGTRAPRSGKEPRGGGGGGGGGGGYKARWRDRAREDSGDDGEAGGFSRGGGRKARGVVDLEEAGDAGEEGPPQARGQWEGRGRGGRGGTGRGRQRSEEPPPLGGRRSRAGGIGVRSGGRSG